MFYLTGLVAVLAATALPSTRAARMPSILLLALTMLAERIAVTSDSAFLQVPAELRRGLRARGSNSERFSPIGAASRVGAPDYYPLYVSEALRV
jgi:hypothetical protein